MVERLLQDYLWRQQVEQAKHLMRTASPDVWEDYLAEFRTMDGSLADVAADQRVGQRSDPPRSRASRCSPGRSCWLTSATPWAVSNPACAQP